MDKFTFNILQNHLTITYPKFFIQYVELVYSQEAIIKEGFLLLSKYRNSNEFRSPIFIHCVTNSNAVNIAVEKIQLPQGIPAKQENKCFRIFMDSAATQFYPSIILLNECDLDKLEFEINQILKTQYEQKIEAEQKDFIVDEWLSVFSV